MRESSGTASNLSSLPSGGGGIAPLGDRFQPDLLRGSGSYAVPIHLPKGPNELQPNLSLTYSTGSGNGPFGFGWRLDCPRIERRSDRGVPRYDADDTFVMGDAEVLIPVGGNRYRARTDNTFSFIDRFNDGWRLRTGDGRTMLFGQTPGSREFNGLGVFGWHLDEVRDPAGNRIVYSYHRDGNRLYLAEIRYSIFRLRVEHEPRPDVMRTCRAGFERVTALRVRSLELHCERLTPTLMRTYALSYEQAINGASLLTRLSLSAEENGEVATFPNLTFQYATLDLENWRVREIESEISPPSLEDRTAQLVDFTANALPDILQSSGGRMRLWRNHGNGRFEGPTELAAVPSMVAFERENVAFADLDGNGRVDLFAVNQPLGLVFESDGLGAFKAEPLVFAQQPSMRLASADTRLMDTDGDGVIDLLQTGRSHFLMSRHQPGAGWQEPEPVRRVADLEQFPDVSFGDRGVRLADMSGDGLQDMVSLQSGNVCYWPYLGHGAWGHRIEMERSPIFPRGFREDRVVVADVDGDGCSDIVYFDSDRTLVWINQCGTGFAPPVELPIAPTGSARPRPADFFGDGRASFVWTGPSRHALDSGWRCLRFDDGRKPYLMTRIDNGMGGVSEMEYANSTEMRALDEEVGRDWQHQLPIVVHVVRSIRQRETITGRETLLTMRYHDGVYDGPERDFRGFAEASVETAGDESVPGSRQEVTFFQGEPEHDDLAERERQRSLAGALLTTKSIEKTAAGEQLRQESVQTWTLREEFSGAAGRVWFPHVTAIETREHSTSGGPARIERTQLLDFDAFGNPARRVRESLAEGEPSARWIRSEERFTYVANQAEWLVKLPVRAELRDAAGVPLAVQIRYYDGAPFVGLAEAAADRGLMTRTLELRLLDARLPADYVGGRDFAALGFVRHGAGDTAGWYATTMSVQRDTRGNAVEQRDPMGRPMRITFDADGVYPVRTSDARGRETTLVFNPRAGEPARVTMPDGRAIRYEHDAIGRLAATIETDDAGVEQLVKCWVLDLASSPVSVTSIAPDGPGRNRAEFLAPVDLATAADVSVARVFYDGFGTELLQVATGPDGPGGARQFVASKRTAFNPRGLASVQFPPVFVTSLDYTAAPPVDDACVRQRYDYSGNVTETIGPGAARFRVVRDAFSIEHFEGAPETSVRLEHFDARSRLVRIEEHPGGGAAAIKTSYDLTLDGQIEMLRDDAGQEMARYTFAGTGEPIRIAHRDAGTRTYYRDAGGHLVERVDADGARLFHRHDALGRVIALEHSAPGSQASEKIREIFYDEDPAQPSAGRFLEGRVAIVREAGNETRLSYDHAGHAVREEVTVAGQTLVTKRVYDLQGRSTAIVYPDNRRVEYTLDRSGSVRGIAGVLSDVVYGPDGAVEGYLLANGVEVSMPSDPVSRRLSSVRARRGGTTLREISYEYAPVGSIDAMRDQMPGDTEHQQFSYDGLYRVTGFSVRRDNAAGALLRQGSYTCDATGNLLDYGDTQALTLQYTSAAHPGRVTGVRQGAQTRPVSYNGRGNISSFEDLSAIEYDPFDRVSSITKADGTTLRFAYDIEGRRILKEVRRGAMAIARVLYAAGLFEQHAGRNIRHIYLGKRLVASESVTTGPAPAMTPAFYLSDHHGTVLLSTDGAGNIIHQQRYSPYGATLRSAAALDRYLGRARDAETGLIHLGARYYAPALGRFISADWYVLENPGKPARMPQGYNLYSYGLNNPLAFRDPSGMFIFALIAAIAIGLAIASIVAFAVGFVSGLVYGLSNGEGWGSLLTALEAGLTTTAGMWLGAIAGGAAGFLIGGPGGMVAGAIIGGAMGGMNGLISGVHGIYDWGSVDGWFSFFSDSTWNLLGTSLGNVVHIVNLFYSGADYQHDLSHRQNRHVYEGGFALKSGFAFTIGNVISNAGQSGKGIDPSFIANHEELHIWQQRFFGPLFQLTYVVWGVGGFIAANIYYLFNSDEDWGSLVETAAYYDNPFEYWAYNNDSNWPPSGVNPDLAWG